MIISCRYTDRKGLAKANMILILNPKFENKVHALSLERFSSKKLNDLAKIVGIRYIPRYQSKGLDIPKLDMNISSRRFYGAFLRNVKKEYNDAYRTYFANKLTTTFLVDYKFDDKIESKII